MVTKGKPTTTARKTRPSGAGGVKPPAALKAVVDRDAAATVVTVTEPAEGGTDLRKRELIDLVVERSGGKKKDVKPAVEAMLAILGETLAAGREMNLQPLGKIRINRVEEKGNGRVIVCKLRQADPSAQPGKSPDDDAEDPLADVAE